MLREAMKLIKWIVLLIINQNLVKEFMVVSELLRISGGIVENVVWCYDFLRVAEKTPAREYDGGQQKGNGSIKNSRLFSIYGTNK